MVTTKFRAELKKIMPRYKWIIHQKPRSILYMAATGIQSSGLNRISTLSVVRREKNNDIRDFNNPVEPTTEIKKFARWVNHTAVFNSVAYEEYGRGYEKISN